ncbi:hypothetical protein Tco_0728658 [Tanacetum coccineum]|uniref:Uncharacterized protein n=1 Tax=Tanacetum coccineum TaxID=301880 RepID=A0ABQ4YPG5_9ASTR
MIAPSSSRWKPTGRILKTVGLRWVPAGKIFTSSTTTVDSEPPHGSNTAITNLQECIQTLDSSAGTSINVQEEHNLDLSAVKMEIQLEPTSNKLSVVTNRFTHIVLSALRCSDIENKLAWLVLTEPKRWRHLIPAESDSLPHAHAQTTKTYYKHQDSRIKKAQEFKTKTSASSDIQDLPLRCQVYQGRLLASFQDDAMYDHVG